MAASNIPAFKHYCRVCKKGFMCGRALGGHMRAHGIGDETATPDDEDDDNASDWEGAADRVHSPKRMYQLRTNPNRLKSCRTCENCGKEFLSWKSFLEHGNAKCSSDDASESLVSSPDSDDGDRRSGGCWSKRRRSLRSKVGSLSSTCSDEDDLLLATCLVQLANTTVDLPTVEPEESSCASASKEEERRNSTAYIAPPKSRAGPRGLFECKACKKVFNSHQALGGHRASHKKVKGCYAAKQDEPDDNNNNVTISPTETDINDQELFPSTWKPAFQNQVGTARRKSKVHECSICHRVFNSGQALGGHKRCHWIISNSPEMPKFQFQDQNADKLDLNVPAWADVSGVRRDLRNPLSFDVSTDIKLRPWIGARDNNAKHGDDNNNVKVSQKVMEDEADSKLKLAKLSDLNDTKVGSSQWLQVGIGSTTTTETAAGCGSGEATPG